MGNYLLLNDAKHRQVAIPGTRLTKVYPDGSLSTA
jgi:hypothetical protein